MGRELRFDGICKTFHGVPALNDISFETHSGEVLAMVGENGAGKSTLLKILGGDYLPSSGSFSIDGEIKRFESPNQAIKAGVGIIYQERQMVPNLSVAENIFMGELPKKHGFVDYELLENRAQALLDEFGVDVRAGDKIKSLSVAMQQMVEIIKVYSRKPKLIAFDEPTTALTKNESEVLFNIIENKLKKQDIIIVYVSHRMEEIFRLSDRIVVLKDGKLVEVADRKATSEDEIVNKMVGRPLRAVFQELAPTSHSEAEVLQVNNFSGRGFRDVSFNLKKGEILGFFGLVGAGRTELMRGIFGADPVESGTLIFHGRKMRFKSPAQSVKNRIGFLTEDRKDQGIFPIQSVRDNMSVAVLKKLKTLCFISRRKENSFAEENCRKFTVKTSSIFKKISELSGGNQQKTLIARWLSMEPEILILDEPTKGIDVGAKSEVYRLIRDIADGGISVILVTSELPEAIGLSDRLYVMKGGRLVAELNKKEATEGRVIACAMLPDISGEKKHEE